MKLACDICGGPLEMMAGGQSAVCVTCGMGYSLERLKEKMGTKNAAKPMAADVIYDVVDYTPVDVSLCSPEKAREVLRTVLVQTYGEKAIFPDALLGRKTEDRADFLVRAEGHHPAVFFIIRDQNDLDGFQRARTAAELWAGRGCYWFIVFESDCLYPKYVKQWVSEEMKVTIKHD